MTGKELILLILLNDLEDEPIDKDGKLIGFRTIEEVAMANNVGVETVKAWIKQGTLESVVTIGGLTLIPDDSSLVVVRENR